MYRACSHIFGTASTRIRQHDAAGAQLLLDRQKTCNGQSWDCPFRTECGNMHTLLSEIATLEAA